MSTTDTHAVDVPVEEPVDAKTVDAPVEAPVDAPVAVVKDAKPDHPDAAYIKSDELGLVIAKGMAVMYKARPENPVDFLAKWLLNYSSIQKSAVAAQNDHSVQVQELKDKLEYTNSQERK
jgi:hypothetical protein